MGTRYLLTWEDFAKQLLAWECANPSVRITRVFFSDECPTEYTSLYSQAPVSHGKPAFMLSTGVIEEI